MAMSTKLALISFSLLLLTFILLASATARPTGHHKDELISTKSTFPQYANLGQSNSKEQAITKNTGGTSTGINDSNESLMQQEKRSSHSRKIMAIFHIDSKVKIKTTLVSVLVNYVKHYMPSHLPYMPSTLTSLSVSSLPASSTSSPSLIKSKASKQHAHPYRRALTEKSKAQEAAPTHQELIPNSTTQGQGTHGDPHATVDESSAFHVDYNGPKTHPPKNN